MLFRSFIAVTATLLIIIVAPITEARFLQTDPVGYEADYNLYTYVGNDPMNYLDPMGELQVDAQTAKKYPKAAAYLTNKRIHSQAKYQAFKTYGQASRMDVNNAFLPGRGPTIKGEDINAWGRFTPNTGSQVLEISNKLLEAFENGVEGSQTMLDATSEHETTHYFDDQDGVDYPSEEGEGYESDVYGAVFQTYDEAAEYEQQQSNLITGVVAVTGRIHSNQIASHNDCVRDPGDCP